jgi:hypothetical protein
LTRDGSSCRSGFGKAPHERRRSAGRGTHTDVPQAHRAAAMEKLEQTRDRQKVLGAMDHDDFGSVLPPPDQHCPRIRVSIR